MERKNMKEGLTLIIDELVQQGITLEQARDEFEKQFIVASIRSNRGNLCRSARSLGVHRNTVLAKLAAWNVHRPGDGRPPGAQSTTTNA